MSYLKNSNFAFYVFSLMVVNLAQNVGTTKLTTVPHSTLRADVELCVELRGELRTNLSCAPPFTSSMEEKHELVHFSYERQNYSSVV